jgi:hypothetical protein
MAASSLFRVSVTRGTPATVTAFVRVKLVHVVDSVFQLRQAFSISQ